MDTRQQTGRKGESAAAQFLTQHGMKLLSHNFRCPLGEIDLVGLEGKTIVFVEVRSRSTSRYGTPQESITIGKQKRLTRLARWYLKKNGLEGKPARFDVVAVMWRDGLPEVTWIVNAFEARD